MNFARDLNLWLLGSIFFLISNPVFGGVRSHFLSRGPGAHASAIGTAYSSISDDLSAIFYNPSGLYYQGAAIMVEHQPVLAGGRLNFLAGHYPSKYGSFGLGIYQFSAGDILTRRAVGDVPGEATATQTAFFLPYSFYYKNVSFGATLKRVEYNLGGNRDDGYGLDLGLLKKGSFLKTRSRYGFSAVIRNAMRPSMTLIQDEDIIPREGSVGFSLSRSVFGRHNVKRGYAVRDHVTLSVDLNKNEDTGIEPAYGFEYMIRNQFPIRIGFRDDFTMGLGYGHVSSPFRIDYSLRLTDVLPQHRMTFSYQFSQPRPGFRITKKSRDMTNPLIVLQGQTHNLKMFLIHKLRTNVQRGSKPDPLTALKLLAIAPQNEDAKTMYKHVFDENPISAKIPKRMRARRAYLEFAISFANEKPRFRELAERFSRRYKRRKIGWFVSDLMRQLDVIKEKQRSK